ncbi:MAG: hypothetical protein M1834_008477 [Cirrosporium novae-zelandiae]|nr:MAG: hypothetical protein M1834_008477 [Cirrosporium novae-zelandiae]
MATMPTDIWKSIPYPTIDHPFGIKLWPIFDQVYSAITGYSPQDFQFIRDDTLLSTFKGTACMLVAYYVIIFGGRELMKNRTPLRLNALFILHNFILTSISSILLALFTEQLLSTVWNHGLFFSICSHRGGWTRELITLYYLNYLVKYIEFIDTIFLVLKKKPLTFLHTYHHGATALLCWTQLIGNTAVSWVVITLNLMVHVVMYWYYFQSSRGIRIWWKEWITRLQILQFVIDLGFVYFASYTYFTSTYFPWMPSYGSCAGEEFAAFAGIGIISSYLLLFISFYVATYKKSTKGRPRRNTGEAVHEFKRAEVPTLGQATEIVASANGYVNGSAEVNGSAKTNGSIRSRKA